MVSDPAGVISRRLTGRPTLESPPLVVRAGRVEALLDGADLRHVSIAGTELVQRVYVAVRDAPWNTIPAIYSDWHHDIGPDAFVVTFQAIHRHGSIDFAWDGRIEGTADGVIHYTMDGVCRGVFAYSKIGFNVHHALDGAVGRPYVARTEDGPLVGVLPAAIDPQRIVDGTLSGMFTPYDELAIEVVDGLEAVIALDGDRMELQDHRNWTDANFKSYGTPLAVGFPFDSRDGQTIRQMLTVTSRGTPPARARAGFPIVRVGAAAGGPLPAIGLGMASHGQPLSPAEVERLRPVRPAHLRVDLALNGADWAADFERAAADARALGTGLELALALDERRADALADLAARISGAGVAVARVLIYLATDGFSAMLGLTPAPLVRLVRDHLEPVTGPVVFAGGTNQNFSDINRDRPSDPVLTGICFSISPTVHAADDASIMENVAGAGEVVRMARTFSGDRAICVSPVTIATRFGPYPAGPAAPVDLPPAVDVRMAALLGAGWTVGAVKSLAEAGVASLTLYETVGWRGVVETDAGNPMPDRFPSRPGDTFPIAHVLADIAEWADGRIVPTTSSQPLAADALVVRTADGTIHALVANLRPTSTRLEVHGLPSGPARRRVLDVEAMPAATQAPATFRAATHEVSVVDGRLALDLGPYAIARVDAG